MAALDHWHPVLLGRELRRKPVAVRLCDREIVLFRTRDGAVGALEDRCPHRNMRLSKGWVENDRLVCPYHGFSYDRQGHGQCPATATFRPRARCLEVAEHYGVVWVKEAGSSAEIPNLDFPGYHPLATVRFQTKAPMELVLDNFTEVEHTTTGHLFFGYPLDRMKEVESRVELAQQTVHVVNVGPQKWVPPLTGPFLGMYTGDRFTAEWTTHFAPVYTLYDMWWEHPTTGKPRPARLKELVFFNPISATETSLVLFFFSTRKEPGWLGLNTLRRLLITQLIHYEWKLDRRLVEDLANKDPNLRGCQLGRFDRVLVENRKRIETVYHGRSAVNGEGPSKPTDCHPWASTTQPGPG